MRRSRSGSGWTLVVPVRDPRTGKTRLNSSPTLNTAIAADTVSAALASPAVRRIILVTDDLDWIPQSIHQDFRCTPMLQSSVDEDRKKDYEALKMMNDGPASPTSALNRAVSEAVQRALRESGRPSAVAVMPGDLPALRPGDLSAALRLARGVPRGMVSDHTGTGTTLLTARGVGGEAHRPRFGRDSALRHRQEGYQELPLPPRSSLRRDVDSPEDLLAVQDRLGARTRGSAEVSRLLGQPAQIPAASGSGGR